MTCSLVYRRFASKYCLDLLTAEEHTKLATRTMRFSFRLGPCGICGGQGGTGESFLVVFQVSPATHSAECSTLIIHHPRLVGSAQIVADVASELCVSNSNKLNNS
jgi:hypothetical protein